MFLAQHKALHAAHRRTDNHLQPLHIEALGEHPVLGLHHVVIIIARERGTHPVARLGTVAMAQIVGRDHIIARKVQRLPRPEQFIPERGPQKRQPAAARPVQQHHRIDHMPVRVPLRRAKRIIIHGDRWQRLASAEAEIGQLHCMLLRLRLPVFSACLPRAENGCNKRKRAQNPHGRVSF